MAEEPGTERRAGRRDGAPCPPGSTYRRGRGPPPGAGTRRRERSAPRKAEAACEAGTAPVGCGLRRRPFKPWSQETPLTEAAASGCGRGAGCDPPPPPPPQLPPPPAAWAPTRTRTAGLSRAHPFLERPSPPSSPQSAASRRAHARRPEACARPLAPWAPPREPRADSRARLLQSDRARGAQRREHAGSGPTAPSTSAGGYPKPSFRRDNGRSEFRTFALGKGLAPGTLGEVDFTWHASRPGWWLWEHNRTQTQEPAQEHHPTEWVLAFDTRQSSGCYFCRGVSFEGLLQVRTASIYCLGECGRCPDCEDHHCHYSI
ncbi:glutamate receptor ionotropic, NMDA 2D-like [Pteropus medius]|uniref:glutamate receptor ionotropic, NMDA 2D-like n=1 Tax=Pteropus vampyrus TaxID=132908 RepID=UPI00196B311D|nr:glutamate receptor ionotropic, NMDA 2D-like [Pteropus giganteus]